ncbi:MAG: Rrf2 family transcriptional regulator [Pseudomonadota bacterium]
MTVALHIMVALAKNTPRRMPSTELAKSVGANPVTIRRVVAALVDGGLVETQPGIGGGVALTRTASSITVEQIHSAVGRPAWFKATNKPPYELCSVSVCMPRVVQRLNEAIDCEAAKVMSGVTLQALVDEEIA